MSLRCVRRQRNGGVFRIRVRSAVSPARPKHPRSIPLDLFEDEVQSRAYFRYSKGSEDVSKAASHLTVRLSR